MFALKDSQGLIVDVTEKAPTITAESIYFNDVLYTQLTELSVVEGVPDYVKPQRFKQVGADFTPVMDNMNEYENLLMQTAVDNYTMQLIDGGVL